MGKSVEDTVLRRLRSARIEARRDGPDMLLVSVMGGEPVALVLEIKHRFSDVAIDQVEALEAKHLHPVVLVIPKLSPRRREELRARELSWIEYSTGHAHVRAPGLAIDLPAEPDHVDEKSRADVPSLAGKAGIIVEALLELPDGRGRVSQPEVAERSGSTQAWTSKVFQALVDTGVMEMIGAGPRKEWCPDAEGLMDLWIEDGGPVPRETGIYAWARSGEHLLGRLGALENVDLPYAVGGAAAADLHEPTLTSSPTPNLWIPAENPAADVARALDGEVVDSGANLLVWQAPGDPALRLADRLAKWRSEAKTELRDLFVVTPARAVVESLRASGRGPEAGENLRRTILGRSQRRTDDGG